MKKIRPFVLAAFEILFCANAWATTPGGGGGNASAPEIPAGAGLYVLAGVVGVVFLVRYFTRKK